MKLSEITNRKSNGNESGKILNIVSLVIALLMAVAMGVIAHITHQITSTTDESTEKTVAAESPGNMMPTFPEWPGSGTNMVEGIIGSGLKNAEGEYAESEKAMGVDSDNMANTASTTQEGKIEDEGPMASREVRVNAKEAQMQMANIITGLGKAFDKGAASSQGTGVANNRAEESVGHQADSVDKSLTEKPIGSSDRDVTNKLNDVMVNTNDTIVGKTAKDGKTNTHTSEAGYSEINSKVSENIPNESVLGNIVPIKKGLQIVTAINDKLGDYESIKEIRSVSEDAVVLNYVADIPHRQNPDKDSAMTDASKTKYQTVASVRKILRTDLQNAHEYYELFGENSAQIIVGTTALGVSSTVFNELNANGKTNFVYQSYASPGGLGGIKCLLKRVTKKVYAFPLLINGNSAHLPAVHATCDGKFEKAEFYFLDDPGNPISLTWRLGGSSRLQVVQINYTPDNMATNSASAQQLEKKLLNKEKVEIYSIYFNFASVNIRPQSKSTFEEIASVMDKHPDWKVSISGHTDNIGGNASNLNLSRRRAEAVKQVLVNKYHIGPERLTTSGFGESAPVDTNDTMEGRARNRRVELARI